MAKLLSFPAQEPQYFTRLSFKKYNRFPSTSVPEIITECIIRLPIPASLTDDYGMEVSTPSFSVLGNLNGLVDAFSGSNSLEDAMTKGASMIEQKQQELRSRSYSVSSTAKMAVTASAMVPGLTDTVVGGLPKLFAGTSLSAFTSSIAGVVRNPHVTSVFEGVRLKSYAFAWKLSPKSADEAKKINSIIHHIKHFMHPEPFLNTLGLEYPHIANLSFEGLPEAVVPKVRDSFVTNLSVSGTPAFFKDGQPVVIDLGISFQEITALNRDNFDIDDNRARELP
jgi:hypothetical protein